MLKSSLSRGKKCNNNSPCLMPAIAFGVLWLPKGDVIRRRHCTFVKRHDYAVKQLMMEMKA